VLCTESSNLFHRQIATAAFHNSDCFNPPKCHPKTRLAVLSEIMKWVKWEGDLNSFIMWVYGPAGAGKSAIAQTIAEMCEDEMILLASFFFSRNDSSRSNTNPLIATLAYQITLNIPSVRDAIFGAVERDQLIFSKSLASQFKSLIVEPLAPLVDAGIFNGPTSRRLVIIDGLDECSDPEAQQAVLHVLANAQRQYRLPLIFLVASRPEQHICLAMSSGAMLGVTTHIALDDSYFPKEDIRLFFTDKFQEIKFTHRLRAYLPLHWPHPNVLQHLVEKSSGQFIYASTVIHYVSSIRHNPQDRLDIVLGIHPPQQDLPFAELDALYMHILAGVEDIDSVMKILSFLLMSSNAVDFRSPEIEEFLSLKPGDVELYLGDLPSLVNIGPNHQVSILHASLTDFLMDHTRSKGFWINPPARHTALAHLCLQFLQCKGTQHRSSLGLVWLCFDDTASHCKNGQITPELRNDLINLSFDDIRDTFNITSRSDFYFFNFFPHFLEGFEKLVRYFPPHTVFTHLYTLRNSVLRRQIMSASRLKLASMKFSGMSWESITIFLEMSSFLVGSLSTKRWELHMDIL
jgi:hypothetical protein